MNIIANQLEDYLRPVLPGGLGRFRLTFLATIDGRPESDILVTEADEATIRDAVARRFAGDPVVDERKAGA